MGCGRSPRWVFRGHPLWVTSEALAGFSGNEHPAPRRIKSSTLLPNLDFQFQIDGKFFGDGFLNAADKLFDVFTGGTGFSHDKVCVPFTDPGRTDGQALESALFNERPGTQPAWVAKDTTC